MATELRLCYSADYLDHVALSLSQLTQISTSDFVAFVTAGSWADMALKERAGRLTDALIQFLPGPFEADLEILKALLPEITGDQFKYADMLAMFVPDYVERKGSDNAQLSIEALAVLTRLGTTSELAIRPFILRDPHHVMAHMLTWAEHEHHHVRRFASEGCRPRLPWAIALPEFKKDPSLVLPILETLKADDSKFVQKSVANNLNDIAKDNPDKVLDFAEKWIDTHPNTNWIIKHGCRTLLKAGNSRALALFGASPVQVKHCVLELSATEIRLGNDLNFSFTAELEGKLPATLRIDYAVDFMKANGKQSRKVFRLSEEKTGSKQISVAKKHPFTDFTTRKHYAGEHGLSIILNGQEVASSMLLLKT
ncbi:MAG: DNA alkylation repair protein [Sneathiellales bacterium]|nr:DNA alkylation repair protein [Sneathiellales bacterium]